MLNHNGVPYPEPSDAIPAYRTALDDHANRLAGPLTPSAHKATHAYGGADALDLTKINAYGTNAARTGLTLTAAMNGLTWFETDTATVWQVQAGAWVVWTVGVPRVTALTAGVGGIPNPVPDGFEVVYVADDTNAVEWHLKYKLSTTKWRFLGGNDLIAAVETAEATASGTYTNLTTVGPSITVPLAGDYDVTIAVRSTASSGFASYDVGATGAIDADAAAVVAAITSVRTRKKTGLAASAAIVAKYKGSSITFTERVLRVRPIRVS